MPETDERKALLCLTSRRLQVGQGPRAEDRSTVQAHLSPSALSAT